jgi:hypothetical protein
MKTSVRRAVVLLTMVGVCLVPLLPPQHLHRGVLGKRHAFTLIHRHLAPHTTPNGTHVERPGVEEGAPQWLADPLGAVPQPPAVPWDVTRPLWHALVPPLGSVDQVLFSSDTVPHASLLRSPDLRGPPFQT